MPKKGGQQWIYNLNQVTYKNKPTCMCINFCSVRIWPGCDIDASAYLGQA